MNILHIAADYKFIPFVADIFNALDGVSNVFLIEGRGGASSRLSVGRDNFRFIDVTYLSSRAMADDLAWCDCLIVHFLDMLNGRLVLNAPQRVIVVWSAWGGDYYEFAPNSKANLLNKDTKNLVAHIKRNQLAVAQRGFGHTVSRMRQMMKGLYYKWLQRRIIKRVDFFSAPIREEFAFVQDSLKNIFRAQYLQLNYASVEHTFAPGPAMLTGNNILVGNSADPTNNHAEIFQALARLDWSGREIIVPLSYGDPEYRDTVIAYGKELFGTSFRPVVDFLTLEDYNTLIATCSIVIMGHRRQQALGNIGTMVYKGAKLFLCEESVVYGFFKGRGAFTYGLGDLSALGEVAFVPLTDKQIQKNREILEANWGHEVVLRNVRNFKEGVQARMIDHAQN